MTVALPDAGARARFAEQSVHRLFEKPMFGLPGTLLPDITWPGRREWTGPWHYWWLAQHLDCLIDAATRARRRGQQPAAQAAAGRAHRLLRTVRMRNVFTFVNHYYDDMAWLLLAAHRLERYDAVGAPSPAAQARRHLAASAGRALRARVYSADTPELGGGLYWNDRRDFKNVPATGPAAIFAARTGDTPRARALVDWMYAAVHEPDSGLFRDGLRVGADGTPVLVRDIYTYNQGTVLGALVELGDASSLTRAAALIDAIETRLTYPGTTVLTTHGGHDGGLFTGITARYLALAAQAPGLDRDARLQAYSLVTATADALWAGRDERRPPSGTAVFSPDPMVPADQGYPPGSSVELSTQLQAWMTLEAAATLE